LKQWRQCMCVDVAFMRDLVPPHAGSAYPFNERGCQTSSATVHTVEHRFRSSPRHAPQNRRGSGGGKLGGCATLRGFDRRAARTKINTPRPRKIGRWRWPTRLGERCALMSADVSPRPSRQAREATVMATPPNSPLHKPSDTQAPTQVHNDWTSRADFGCTRPMVRRGCKRLSLPSRRPRPNPPTRGAAARRSAATARPRQRRRRRPPPRRWLWAS